MLGFLVIFYNVSVDPLLPDSSVIMLDIGVLLRFAGLACWIVILSFSVQIRNVPLIYFGLLSTRLVFGLLRYSIILFKLRMTRSTGSEKSTSILSTSRLKSSSTFNSRNWRLSASLFAMKSIDQVIFGPFDRTKASGLSRFNRFYSLICKFSSRSQ